MKATSSRPDNLYKISWAFLQILKVPVTRTALRNALGFTDSEINLSTLTDAFSQWKIESIAVRINQNQLDEIELPAIAHMTTNGIDCFVMLTKWQAGQITYLDSELGSITEAIDTFAQKWKGVTFLAVPDKESGEKDYVYKRRQEILKNLRTWIPVVIAVFCIGWGLSQPMPWSSVLLCVVKTIGIILSIFLLWEVYGPTNSLLDRICQVNNQTDCRTVLNSSAAKLFGWIGMTEIGFIYFTGGLLTIIWSTYGRSQPSVMPYLSALNVLALPYTIFSIYYQGWIIKKWCPLCVGVQALLWLEFILGWPWLQRTLFVSSSTFGLILVCFAIPVALWLLIKPLVELAQQVPTLTKELARFRNNTDLFLTLLESEPSHDMQFEGDEIRLGQPNAPVILTMVSGPFCFACATAHQTVESLFAEHSDELQVIIRFAVDANNDKELSNRMARHLLTLASQKPDQLPAALNYWYQIKKVDQLESRFPVIPDDEAEELLQRQRTWINQVGILFTPTFFLNNHQMPKHFTVADLQFHIRQLAERQAHSTPI